MIRSLHRTVRRSATRLGAMALLLGLAGPSAAQSSCRSMAECPAILSPDTHMGQELVTAGINALLGGATAAGMRLIRGESASESWSAFWTGTLGGGVTYAGKRVAVERFGGAGFLGRELASVGGSMVRNASAGRGVLEEIVLPVGPVRLYIGSGPVRARLDLAALVTSGVFIAAYDARLDPEASLSAGALIFRGDTPMPGLSSTGVSVVWADMPASEGPRLMAHERVHILQYDQAFLSWGEALERWSTRQVPAIDGALRHFDLGAAALGIRSGLALALGYHHHPWEREAYFLAQRVFPVDQSPTVGH